MEKTEWVEKNLTQIQYKYFFAAPEETKLNFSKYITKCI